MNIRIVESEDQESWILLDKHLSKTEYDEKVQERQGYVALLEDQPVGLLR